MSPNDLSLYNLALCSGFGAVRGALVCTLTHPIDTVRFLLQCDTTNQKARHIAYNIIKDEGFRGFYQGFGANLAKVSIKQLWRWPVLMGTPSYLEKKKTPPLLAQIFTGFTLASFDAFGTTPLERARIVLITNKTRPDPIRLSETIRQGWKGVVPYWTKLSMHWSSFLVSQRYYRDSYRNFAGRDKLSLYELAAIGIAVGGTVSVVTAPFDYINTICQGQDKKLREIVSRLTARNILENLKYFSLLYRGCKLQTAALMIHNVASVILIDWLSQSSITNRWQ